MYLGAEAYSAVSLLGPFTGVIGMLAGFFATGQPGGLLADDREWKEEGGKSGRIRMVMRLAKDVQYFYTFSSNNLLLYLD